MDDRQAQFLILVGEVSRMARLARLPVEVITRDGIAHRGVPEFPDQQGDEIDDTGLDPLLRIDGELVAVEAIAEIRTRSPQE